MIIGFGNNTVSSLAADITASQTTIQVMPGAGALFARLLTYDYVNSSNTLKTYAKITLTDAKETVFEICHLTAVDDDMLTVVRGQEGTTAKGWSLNDVIANFATRGSENQFVQIEELQSGHYTSGIAGGTANALTIALPATYFVNGSTDWTLRTPLVIYPSQNNTGAATLQLTMGGRVLGTFPLYKGNKAQLAANDILKDVALVCLMDKTKTFFSVANPGAIYAGLGTAAFKDIVTSMTDETAGRIPVVGWEGLGGIAVGTNNASLLSPTGTGGRIFSQGNTSDANHFGGYGCGLHMVYGQNGAGTQRLTANLFIDSNGTLSAEWLAINISDGTIVAKNVQQYLPLTGGTMSGQISLPNTGRGSFASQNDNGAPLYQNINSGAPSEYWPIFKQHYQQGNLTWSGGMLINEGDFRLHYLDGTGGTTNFRWTKDGQFIPPNYANFDAKYQPKGNYTPAGQAYTKAESDGRFQKINTASKAANGWFKDTNTGMIFQWGVQATSGNNSFAVTFPVAFPSVCVSVNATRIGTTNAPTVAVNGVSRTGATIKQADGGDGGSYWYAIGY